MSDVAEADTEFKVRCPICLYEFDWSEAWYMRPTNDVRTGDGQDFVGRYFELLMPGTREVDELVADRIKRAEAVAICPSDASVRPSVPKETTDETDAAPEAGGRPAKGLYRHRALFIPPWEEGQRNLGLYTSVTAALHPMHPSYGEAPSLFVPIVGTSTSGKTSLVAAMNSFRQDLKRWASENGLEISLTPQRGVMWQRFLDAVPVQESGDRGPQEVRPTQGSTGWHIYFRLEVSDFRDDVTDDPAISRLASRAGDQIGTWRSRPPLVFNLVFADYAGEDFRRTNSEQHRLERTKNLQLADMAICVVSSEELSEMQRQNHPAPDIGAQDLLELFQEELNNRDQKQGRPVPLAYVLTKADLLYGQGLMQGYLAGCIDEDAPPEVVELDRYLEPAVRQSNATYEDVVGSFRVPVDPKQMQGNSAKLAGMILAHQNTEGRLTEALDSRSSFGPVTVHAVSARTGRGVFEPLLALLMHRGLIGGSAR